MNGGGDGAPTASPVSQVCGSRLIGLELRPPRRHALAIAETASGTLLTLGALTPLASAMVTGTLVTAIRKVHAGKGPWHTAGGFEYNLVLSSAMAALADQREPTSRFTREREPALA